MLGLATLLAMVVLMAMAMAMGHFVVEGPAFLTVASTSVLHPNRIITHHFTLDGVVGSSGYLSHTVRRFARTNDRNLI